MRTTRKVGFFRALGLFVTRSFDFKGRSGRREYWWMAAWGGLLFVILFGVIMVKTQWVDSLYQIFQHPLKQVLAGNIGVIVTLLIGLWWSIAGTALVARRIRDAGYSPWLALISVGLDIGNLFNIPDSITWLWSLLTLVGSIYLLTIVVKPSVPEKEVG